MNTVLINIVYSVVFGGTIGGLLIWIFKTTYTQVISSEFKRMNDQIIHKFTRLHDKRIEVISTIYEKLVVMEVNFHEMTSLLRYEYKDDPEKNKKLEDEKIQKSSDSYNDFFLYYFKTKIFLSESTCELIEAIRKQYLDTFHDYTSTITIEDPDGDYVNKMKVYTANVVRSEIPKAKAKIEDDFRKIIGTD